MHLKGLIKIHLIILYLFYLICISEGYFCTVPNKCVPCSSSVCSSCPYIKEIMNKQLTEEDRTILGNSICKENHICCPIDLPVPPVCGICYSSDKNRIFGGEDTALEEFPWTVLLKRVIDGVSYQGCTGTLINKRYVLTAAHCITYKIIETDLIKVVKIESVRLGEWNKTSAIDCINHICSDQTVDINVEKVILHEKYRPAFDAPDDIALLRLAKDVIYTTYIQPICLPIENELKNNIYNNSKSFIVVGWGLTEHSNYSSEIKLKAKLPSYDQLKCRDLYQKEFRTNITNSQFCAGGAHNIDTCKGDSGGPLMYLKDHNETNREYYLAGIVSFGPTPCATNNMPEIYTRVASYLDWILDKIEP